MTIAPVHGEPTSVAKRITRQRSSTVVGINVGKTKVVPDDKIDVDYRQAVQIFTPHADYLVINVSSPNTPGLRDLQTRDRLVPLIQAVRSGLTAGGVSVPLLLKIGPDLSDAVIDEIAELAVELELDGIVAVNTTVDPAVLTTETHTSVALGAGGISGAPLQPRSLAVLRRICVRVGERLVIVSVGGIETADDAWERILAGASLGQASTALVYGGPLWPSRLNRQLATLVKQHGVNPQALQRSLGWTNTRLDHATKAQFH